MKISKGSAPALLLAFVTLPFLSSCTVKTGVHKDSSHSMEVSIPQQRMAVYHNGQKVKEYPVSTSKFGVGDEKGSYKTPIGKFEVVEKIGTGKPLGAVFKSRQWTGEILKPNAPGRDPIVSRILWLNGLEPTNRNAYSRCIYVHGTAAERDVGKKASYGCVRMKSRDIIELYDRVGWGSPIEIVDRKLWSGLENPELPLNEDGSIPELAYQPARLLGNSHRGAAGWESLSPEEAAEALLEQERPDASYLEILPVP